MTCLPTAEQLEKLTLRAIAAYAARSARRGSEVLRGVVEDDIIEAILRMAEKLASVRDLNPSDGASSALAGSRLALAMGALKTSEAKLAAICINDTGAVVRWVLTAASPEYSKGMIPSDIAHAAAAAAKAAERAARALGQPAGTEAIDAARRDYEILLKEFGEHQNVMLGEPIDLSDEWWQEKGTI